MAEQTNREELASRYLLGGLSENEAMTLEEQILSDDGVFENLEVAEDELIDRYVRDDLSAGERRRVREMILNSPRLAERVEIARILTTKVASQPATAVAEKKTPWWSLFLPTSQMAPAMRLVAVAPLALLLVTSVLLVLMWTRYRNESQRWARAEQRLSQLEKEIADQNAKSSGLETALTQTQQEKAEQEKLLADLQQQLAEQRGQTRPSVFSFFINPGVGSRSGGGVEASVRIPPEANEIKLELNVEGGDYPQYEATLQDSDLNAISKPTRLRPIRRGNRKIISFKIPTRLVRPGSSYSVHVDGLNNQAREDFNDYRFRVTR